MELLSPGPSGPWLSGSRQRPLAQSPWAFVLSLECWSPQICQPSVELASRPILSRPCQQGKGSSHGLMTIIKEGVTPS